MHGANRLASNSLTEGVVAGTRVGRDLAWELPDRVEPDVPREPSSSGLLSDDDRIELRTTMSRHVVVMRTPEGLAAASAALTDLSARVSADVVPSLRSYEATNLLTVASALVASATARTESRGCHRRSDFTEPRDVWLTHLLVGIDDGGVHVDGVPDEEH